MLVQQPELIYQALEQRMEEDWGIGNDAGGATSILSLCSSQALGDLGDPLQQVDRREMAGALFSKAARHSRLPRQEVETCSGQPQSRRSSFDQGQGWRQGFKEEEEPKRGCKGSRSGQRGGEDASPVLTAVTEDLPGMSQSAYAALLEDDPNEALHVPGAKAPVCDILRFWSSMPRWMLRTAGSLSSFFRSMIGLSPSTSEGSALSPWPMPVPYPKWFVAGNEPRPGHAGYKTMGQQKAVNFVIVVLSWLFLNRPSVAPSCIGLHARLSKKQWAVVHRFERQLAELASTDAVGPEQMGRTAAKVESLDSLLEKLHEQAVRWLPEAYKKQPSEPVVAKLGAAPDAGRVVGSLKCGNSVVAKDVETSRLSIPEDPPEFDPGDLLPPHHREVFRDPVKFAVDPTAVSDQPPRVQLHASRSQAFELLHFLDQRQRLTLAPASKVRPSHLCGVFALIKDQMKDRMILDARPPNMLEEALNEWTTTLGAVTALIQIELKPGHHLWMSGTDLCDYYYCYRVSKQRAYRNALAFSLSPQQAASLQCFDQTMYQHPKLYPCLATLAMGDNQAVELGQCAHVNLGLFAGAFKTHELLTTHGRAPRGAIACGVVIDDVLIAEQVCPESACEYTEGEERLDKLCEEYLQRGLRPHPKKTFRKSEKTECCGALIDGVSGLVRAAPKRLIPLMWISARVALLGFATVSLLQILTGSWVSVLQIRRRMLCLLDHLYFAQQGRLQEEVIQLSEDAKSLRPGPDCCGRFESSESWRALASEEFTASVKAPISCSLAREVQRHCLARGAWNKLLTPWESWLKSHGQLFEENELPAGVPLVSHPLWLELAESLQFHLHHKRQCLGRKHINILELQSILEVEERLARRRRDCRYVLGADSQVALAALVKGRSSSPCLNTLLRRSLPNVLGNGLYGSYGFLPSLSNVADDPTRSVEIRAPSRMPVFDLKASLAGDFHSLDAWLGKVGFTTEQVAGVPFSAKCSVDSEAVQKLLLQPLRSVQKAERLQIFDAKYKTVFSPGDVSKEMSREHEEPESQTKSCNKSPKKLEEEVEGPSQAVSFGLKRVAPHAKSKEKLSQLEITSPKARRRANSHVLPAEHMALPKLSAEAQELLALLPRAQFFAPGGRRAAADFVPVRQGFLDLYSGKAGVARILSKRYHSWVLTLQDLLDAHLQARLFELMRAGAFWGAGAAPECASFSRAVNPPVRSRDRPEGLKDLTPNMQIKVARGNAHALFVLEVLKVAEQMGLVYWVENPDGSFLWLLRPWLESGLCRFDRSYRFDMCTYKMIWRKRTRVCTNTVLAGVRELCKGGHSHQQLRGRSLLHQASWTKVAQVYPQGLCFRLADALAEKRGLGRPLRRRLNVNSCARCLEGRIGEASNPGPPAQRVSTRNVGDLFAAQLHEPSTLVIQNRVWRKFDDWLRERFSAEACAQVFLCPMIAAQMLRQYGLHCFETGGAMYELRHLLVAAGRQFPLVKPVLGPAWDVLARWEEISPVQHRIPLPEILFKAMFTVAVFKGWKRWAATLLLGYEGIARIGEVLQALRRDLVLPSDLFECDHMAAFLRVRKPKSRRRGKDVATAAGLAALVAPLQAAYAKLPPLEDVPLEDIGATRQGKLGEESDTFFGISFQVWIFVILGRGRRPLQRRFEAGPSQRSQGGQLGHRLSPGVTTSLHVSTL
eukprot:s4131_g7.t1